jgi:hypothetical protein
MDSVYNLLDPARNFLNEIAAYLPRLALALLVVVAGWFVAKAVRYAVERALRAMNFNVLTSRAGMDEFLQQGGTRSDTTALFGFLVFWLVVLASLVVAFNTLGLSYATDLIGRLVLFVPKLMLALFILTLGAYFARFVEHAVASHCREAQMPEGEVLAKLAQYAVMTFVVLIALDLTNIGGDLVRETFLIILTGIMLTVALAFGLGGRHWAASMLEHWWPRIKRDSDRRR